jgi:Hok/gef family.
MPDTCRVPLTDLKVKEKGAMKQQKVMLIVLIIIGFFAIMAVLVMRKDLCEVHIRTGQTEVAVFTTCRSA